MSIWVGIDVSKETLDIAWVMEGKRFHRQVSNSRNGFEAILRAAPEEASFLMEATGSYYLNLALHLHRAGRGVSVVNPARIKAHMSTELCRTKSDKADAYAIARFGTEKNPQPWKAVEREMAEMQQLQALDDQLVQQIVALKVTLR